MTDASSSTMDGQTSTATDTEREVRTDERHPRHVFKSRLEQGLPEFIEDPTILAIAVDLLGDYALSA